MCNQTGSAWVSRVSGTFGTLLGLVAMLGSAGCPGIIDPGSGDPLTDGNKDLTATSPLGKTFGEPNDDFDDAMVAVFDRFDAAHLQGSISTYGDIDVFLLGELTEGDRVVVDLLTSGSLLDAAVVLFDGEERLAYENDDRGGVGSRQLDAYFDFVIRRASDSYYLAVSHSPFAGDISFTGNYTIEVERGSGYTVPQPVVQNLVLDFDGGTVSSPILGPFELDVFDAGDISPAYEGLTDIVKDAVVDTVLQNFERFGVTVYTTDGPVPADPESYSTVYFGGFSLNSFGIAEAVDLYNADVCDDAIIFTESFSPAVFTRLPDALELGVAIGNIAAHEAGHLLGLNHVDDDLAIMDAASPADAFLRDQEFMNAPLHSDIMTLGTQDAALLLWETVGPAESGP